MIDVLLHLVLVTSEDLRAVPGTLPSRSSIILSAWRNGNLSQAGPVSEPQELSLPTGSLAVLAGPVVPRSSTRKSKISPPLARTADRARPQSGNGTTMPNGASFTRAIDELRPHHMRRDYLPKSRGNSIVCLRHSETNSPCGARSWATRSTPSCGTRTES
jgi:hypothetical protein